MPLFNGTTKKPNGRVVSIGKGGAFAAGTVGVVAGTGLLLGSLTPSNNQTLNTTTNNNSTTEYTMNCAVGILVNSTECRKRLESNNSTSTSSALPAIVNSTTEINTLNSTLSVNTQNTDVLISTTPSMIEKTTLKTNTYTGTTSSSSEMLSARNTLEIIKEVDE